MIKGIKISIVHDNRIFREGLRFFIEDQTDWCILHETGSGAEFMKLQINEFPDVVLMDINKPDKEGFNLATDFFSKYAQYNIKVIGLTMYANDSHIKSCKEAGISGCLLKKDIYKHLPEAVEEVINNKFYFTSCIQTKR
ncbi:response regulator [Plebeiibacterium sediminum]|uniref:Response regulator transcription factor n=1 Tax=Plebeiibacterium sediminum TaxID=2992112 RepID=A0AAE3M5U6_9BACT|nr:response regulator transcription factor [Plebeiobacterium sediminum]MCW3787811.1 response regulator transcription factor [Plebeiobacterium sediminum]